MGYTSKVIREVTLIDPKYKVQVNVKLTIGDAKELRTFVESMKGKPFADLAESSKLLQLAVTSWNLDDEDGNPLPLTPESFELLDAEDAKLILDMVRASRVPKPVVEQADFLPEPTPGSGDSPVLQLPPATRTSAPPDSSGAISA